MTYEAGYLSHGVRQAQNSGGVENDIQTSMVDIFFLSIKI
jgi:hypothetical protein